MSVQLNTIQNVKVKKKEVVFCIKQYFDNKGQRLTNINKANMEQLEKIIIKYNIGFDYMIDSIIEYRKMLRIEKQRKKDREQQKALEREEREKQRKKQQEINDKIIQSIHIKLRETMSNKYKVSTHIKFLEVAKKEAIRRKKNEEQREETINIMKNRFKTDSVSYNNDTGAYNIRGVNVFFDVMDGGYSSYEHYYKCNQFHDGYILAINTRGQNLIRTINSYYKKYRFQKMPNGKFKMVKQY